MNPILVQQLAAATLFAIVLLAASIAMIARAMFKSVGEIEWKVRRLAEKTDQFILRTDKAVEYLAKDAAAHSREIREIQRRFKPVGGRL